MTDPIWDSIPERALHYDRLGIPISLREWADLMEDRNYRVVRQTLISARYLVSTVWLGIDHGFSVPYPGHQGPYLPVIFETMVFDHGSPHQDLEQERYHSEAAARDGHERYVQMVMTLEGTQDRIDSKTVTAQD